MHQTSSKTTTSSVPGWNSMITVDYYEMMKFSHWNPKFAEMAQLLSTRLINRQYTRTGLPGDWWTAAQLTPLPNMLPLTTNNCANLLNQSAAHTLLEKLGTKVSAFETLSPSLQLFEPEKLLLGSVENCRKPGLEEPPTQLLPHTFSITPSTPPVPFALMTAAHSVPIYRTPLFEHTLTTPNWNQLGLFDTFRLLQPTGMMNNPVDVLKFPLTPQQMLPQFYPLNTPLHFNPTSFTQSPLWPGLSSPRLGLFNPLMDPTNPLLFSPTSNLAPFINTSEPPLAVMNDSLIRELTQSQMEQHNPWLDSILKLSRMNSRSLQFNHLSGGLLQAMPQRSLIDQLEVFVVRDEAKTRFMCSTCSRQWTSMKGSITFVIILSHILTGPTQLVQDVTVRPGANVFFELYPQSCADCDVTCQPKWYPEEIFKVIRNLFVRIHEYFYPNEIMWDDRWDSHRRDGQPAGPHDNRKCVACQNGICRGGARSIGQSNSPNRGLMPSTTYPHTNKSDTMGLRTKSLGHRMSSPIEPPKCKRRTTNATEESSITDNIQGHTSNLVLE